MTVPGEKRTERFHARLYPSQKAQWAAAADRLGYKDISSLVEEAVESFIQTERGQDSKHEQTPPTTGEPGDAVTQDGSAVAGTGTPATVPPAGGSEGTPRPAGGSPTCPRESMHRVGTFCKGCNKVITKKG